VKCRIKDSEILGEFKGDTFFKKGDLIGSNRNVCNTSWTKKRPKKPFYGRGPNFTDDSIVWLCDSSGLKDHGDVISQWNYEAGSFLNYTEFTGYEIEILSSEPLILAMRSEKEGIKADWYLVCYNPSKLPFNLIPDFSVNYSPDDVYSAATDVKFICIVKNIPAEAQSNNISYEWDFGDGTKGTGKEVTHRFEKDGTYNVSVSVRLGESVDSSTKSMKLAVLESPDIELTATPRYLTGKGITYVLECKIGKLNDFSDTEWDFRDGQKSKGGLVVSHTYKPGNYVTKVTLYNSDKTQSWQKEISISSKLPDFSASASPLEGNTALNVDFKCDLLSQNLTDSGLKYQWKIGTEVISVHKSFSNVFIEPGTYVIKLEVRDTASELVTEQSLNITVNPIVLTFSDEGRIIQSSSSIFVDTKYDADKDGINQFWENEAMEYINPKFDLDEGEKWFNHPEHHVVNFVRVFPYTKAGHRYILFMYCVTWSKDYGRYGNAGFYDGFYEHNGDVERVIMAWEVTDEDGKSLQLRRVFTSAHGGENDHSAAWDAWNRDCFTRGIALWPVDEEMCGQLVFEANILKLQVSEDKHAIYPTFDCCEDVILTYLPVLDVFVMEDCEGGRENPWSFECYNVGEPNHYLIDDLDNPSSWEGLSENKRSTLTNLFPQEQVWSGRKQHTNKFCGGLAYDEDSPGPIGGKLRDLPSMLTDKL
jgi:PKD repeat protein